MQESSKIATAAIINSRRPATILDAPSGGGWLPAKLDYEAVIDGVDLYAETSTKGYRQVVKADLDMGVPHELTGGAYDCVASCEGIEHLGNPALFIKSAFDKLKPDGFIIITTPNVWYPASKLQYLARGFFPGFPCLTGVAGRGDHMHIMPWSFPQLYLFLELGGFSDIRLHDEPLGRAKHLFEKVVAIPQRIYCKGKLRKAKTEKERAFWSDAMSRPSIHGRHLIVTANKKA